VGTAVVVAVSMEVVEAFMEGMVEVGSTAAMAVEDSVGATVDTEVTEAVMVAGGVGMAGDMDVDGVTVLASV
jgi:hypothetical protein